MKTGILQFDVTHDPDENIKLLKSYLGKNRCELVLLPELSMCGYLFQSREQLMNAAESVPRGPSTCAMLRISKEYSCTIVFGLAEKENQNIYNTAVIVSKGRYIGRYRKIHLSDFEKKLFDRGNENPVFDIDGMKIGVQICFDLWFPEISREQVRKGADILLAPANFGGRTTYHISKIRAIENLTPLVLCNRTGHESIPDMDADFLGKSSSIDARGNRIYTAPENSEDFRVCDIRFCNKKSNVICSDFEKEINLHY